jgi:two-component system sensor histidine kinase VicK
VLDVVAHHISSALTLMQHLSKEAQKHIGSDSDANLKIFLGLLHDNSKTCLEIITGLLKHEHEKSPAIGTRSDRIDIVNKMSIVHDEFTQSYRTREFIFRYPQRVIFAKADDIKLLQVLNNFITNAVKFSPVTEPIIITVDDSNDDVTISVQDRGIGIPDTLKPLIFERQIGTGRVGLKGEKSLGLGLSICKHLVDQMSGKIWFESNDGEGSIFFFSLPKAS